WDVFKGATKDTVVGLVRQKGLDDEKIEQLCLDIFIGMLDYQFKQSHYDSIVLSGLAIMGIDGKG
ncbi:hypothetical protein BGZ61DRAFT_293105, partial [Ilyonectria robusta]|uniref:uncharacterized protein n=1 Tax=Ilyonectria robusta TaxID=1079257 RepID=UPI001E8CF014